MASWNNSNFFFFEVWPYDLNLWDKSMPILKHNMQDQVPVTALCVQFSKFAKNINLDFFQIFLIKRKHCYI